MSAKYQRAMEDWFERDIRERTKPELTAKLDALRPICEGSRSYGIGALLDALQLCLNNRTPLPLWLARAVFKEVDKHAPKGRIRHYRRWSEVRKMRDTRPLEPDAHNMRAGRAYDVFETPYKEISYEDTLHRAAKKLARTPASGSVKSMRNSYELVEADLPKDARYKKTYRKRAR